MKVLISTDSSCLINNSMLKNLGISVYPLNVIVDGEEFLDGITITQDKLSEDMRAGKDIKTSTPPLGDIYDYFHELFSKGYDKIIHFTISSKLSSMYDLFRQVAKTDFPDKLFIIDSYSLSAHMLSQVLFAYDEMKKGTDAEEIVKMAEERKAISNIMFVPENLTALKNGGRVSSAVAVIGNAMGIKPVLALTDGELVKQGTTRHIKKVFIDFIDNMSKKYPVSDYDFTFVQFDSKHEIFNYILENAKKILGEFKYVVGFVPINVCAHCGPGTIGVLISPKINGKSISDFDI